MTRQKVLLDTDIGSDPDDSLCLTYLLKQSACDLLGITTVGPDSPTRAKLAAIFTRQLGAPDIPVAAGADAPYFPNQHWPGHQVWQAPVLDQFPVNTEYRRGQALGLMREIIRANPGEVSLVAVGPLTNVGLLAGADPETAAMVKEVVFMGGFFHYDPQAPRTECNIMLDPVSAGSVVHYPWPELRAVSLDITRGKGITMDQVNQHLDSDPFADRKSVV